MKIERLETHDRLLHFKKDQEVNIQQGVEDCLKRNPDALALQDVSKYIYIYAHPRTSDDGVSKRMLWQPRLSRPEPQTNSYLFRATSKTDLIQICWLLPPRELWPQYTKGKVTENQLVIWSIDQFINNRIKLAMAHPEDYSEETSDHIYRNFLSNKRKEKIDLILS